MYHPTLSQQQDFLNLLSSTNMYCGGTNDIFDTTLLSPQEPSTRSPTPTSCQPSHPSVASTSAGISAPGYCWTMPGTVSAISASPVNEQAELMVAGPPQPHPMSCTSTAAAAAAAVTTPSLAARLFADLDPDYTNTTDFGQGFFHMSTMYLPQPSPLSSAVPDTGLPTVPEHLYQLNDIYRRHSIDTYYRPQAVHQHHYATTTTNSTTTPSIISVPDVIAPATTPADYFHHPPTTIHRKRRSNDKDEGGEQDAQAEFPVKRSKKQACSSDSGSSRIHGSSSSSSNGGSTSSSSSSNSNAAIALPDQPQHHHHHHHLLLQYPNDAAVHQNPSAVPRRQKLRYEGDEYTPKWVRFQGQLKEGYCDHCKPGKWLQLKNSAYWYHKQFFHGISSVSGKRFAKPLEQRASENDGIEGLCHQCRQFVPISNAKRKTSVLWYRHAHKCHVYDKPKPRIQTPAGKRNQTPLTAAAASNKN